MKVSRSLKRVVWGALAVALLMFLGCGEQTEEDVLPEPVEVSRQVVEAGLSSLEVQIREAARAQALKEQAARLVRSEGARSFTARVERGLRYSTVFQREYVDGELGFVFANEEGLTAKGRAVVEVLDKAGEHGLDGSIFRVAELESLDKQMGKGGGEESESFQLSPQELEALVAAVASLMEGAEKFEAEEALGAVLSFDVERELPGLARLREFAQAEQERFMASARQIAELELRVADGALRYAREMRHGNLKRIGWRAMRDAGGSTEIILGWMQGTLKELHEASDEEAARAVMRALEPAHPQYRGLLAGAKRYREIAEHGEWARVGPFKVEVGAKSAQVAALRKRLEREGFLAAADDIRDEVDEAGEVDPQVVDEALIEGIKAYQKTHQFRVDGVPTPGFWRSLNIPVARRIEQIELNLQRWREGYFKDDEDYILVNIPGFSGHLVQAGQEVLSFSVVVGRNNRRCDAEEERWVYPNQTPVMASTLEQVVLNPSWWVPTRLVEEQIRPKVAQNPDYMVENGFEEVVMSDGRTVIRQLPGPDNALGQVKFLFPNGESIYLHDSPQRHFFDYTLRAHSAGCVRVSRPLELARLLLDWEGRQDLDLDEVLASARTRVIDIKEELPVLIEYFTVWVDEEGRPNFLADIYDKDARQWSEDPEEFDRCRPRGRAPQRVIEGDGAVPEDLSEDLGP